MTRLRELGKRCTACRIVEECLVVGGRFLDPQGWTEIGDTSLCAACSKAAAKKTLSPEVLGAAETAVQTLQALMATELRGKTTSTTSMTFGPDQMARRMKRCELLSRYADALMTTYGNLVGFKRATPGSFEVVTLEQCATALEALMRAEVEFSEARAENRRGRGRPVGAYIDEDVDEAGPTVYGPLSRLREVARIAQKLAQLAATRAGHVVPDKEDEILEAAVDAFDDGLYRGRRMRPNMGIFNDPMDMQRQMLMMVQQALEQQNRQQADRAARDNERDERLAKLTEANAILTARAALAAEQSGKDVTPRAVNEHEAIGQWQTPVITAPFVPYGQDTSPAPFTGAAGAIDEPPDAEELEQLRRTLGDDAVQAAFPGARP